MLTQKIYFTIDDGYLHMAGTMEAFTKMLPRKSDVNIAAFAEMLKWGSLLNKHTLCKNVYGMSVGEAVVVSRKTLRPRCERYNSVWGKGVLDERPSEIIAGDLADRLVKFISDTHSNRVWGR